MRRQKRISKGVFRNPSAAGVFLGSEVRGGVGRLSDLATYMQLVSGPDAEVELAYMADTAPVAMDDVDGSGASTPMPAARGVAASDDMTVEPERAEEKTRLAGDAVEEQSGEAVSEDALDSADRDMNAALLQMVGRQARSADAAPVPQARVHRQAEPTLSAYDRCCLGLFRVCRSTRTGNGDDYEFDPALMERLMIDNKRRGGGY